MRGFENNRRTVLAGGTFVAVLAVAGVVAVLAAAGGEDVVAKIGPSRVITRAEFDKQAARQEVPPDAPPDSVRNALLEALIQKELLVLEARERGFFNTRVDSAATAFGDNLMRDRVRMEESKIDSTVTDQMIEASFTRSRNEILMRHIIHWSRTAMDSARTRIDAGESFATVATAVSLDNQTASSGGLLPWINDRQLITEFRVALDPVTIGRVVGPFESAYGWHLAVVDSIRAREGADLEKERDSIRDDLLAERQRDHRNEILAGYRKAMSYVVDEDAISATLTEAEAAYRRAKEDSALIAAPVSEKWSPATPARALATYNGGQVSVADYENHIAAGGFNYLPRRLTPAGIRADVREIFYQRAQLAEAKKRGYDQDPDWQRRVALKREELAVEQLYSEIMQDIRFTDAELRTYYDEHPDFFQRAETLRYSFIEVDDASVAQWLVEEMEGVAKVAFDTTLTNEERQRASVMFDSLEAKVKQTGHLVKAMRDSGNREAWTTAVVSGAAKGMQPGEVGHVIESDGSHVVFIFISREPQTMMSFEESRPRIERTLANMESEKRLKEELAALERKFGVERHPERLAPSQG